MDWTALRGSAHSLARDGFKACKRQSVSRARRSKQNRGVSSAPAQIIALFGLRATLRLLVPLPLRPSDHVVRSCRFVQYLGAARRNGVMLPPSSRGRWPR